MDFKETAYWLDQVVPAPLEFRTVAEWKLGTADLGAAGVAAGQSLAVTANFGDVDTGLTANDSGLNVRCELLAVARTGEAEVAAAVKAAADKLHVAQGIIPAQPGVFLPDLIDGTELEGQVTVRHGLLISPYLWGGEVPQVVEKRRQTLVLQLLLLTDTEYAYALDEGISAMQDAMAEQEIDLLEWSRKDG
ncbi:suppressor of fused domain protein [Corynebacterium incognita]|uniref:Suppressor of fused domain protein n=1 Tax=Corynebacterium incognita TaxID=2754725 RepID=A0A7G7CMC6_9CORY|nr:suppressor of fused domain protein [Corynebacterium incognita]QNE88742.1 suppressor of fused domain protein [Corynebacterium incognita]